VVPPSDFADDGADRAIADLMGIEVSTLNGDAAVVRVTGEVDGYTAPVFQRAVDEGFSQGGRRVLIDLDRVEFFGPHR